MKLLSRIALVCGLVPLLAPVGIWWYVTRLDGEDAESKTAALKCLEARGIAPQSVNILMVVDYDRPSYAKRGAIYEKGKSAPRCVWVAHGAASGKNSEPYAFDFSDEVGSNKSSLGLYRMGKVLPSKEHGTKIMLHGLEPELNGKAEARDIVIHAPKAGQNYVSMAAMVGHLFRDGWFGVGRSHGCPVLCPEDYAYLQDRVTQTGTMNYLFIHHHRRET